MVLLIAWHVDIFASDFSNRFKRLGRKRYLSAVNDRVPNTKKLEWSSDGKAKPRPFRGVNIAIVGLLHFKVG
jgi:hypothetical protein